MRDFEYRRMSHIYQGKLLSIFLVRRYVSEINVLRFFTLSLISKFNMLCVNVFIYFEPCCLELLYSHHNEKIIRLYKQLRKRCLGIMFDLLHLERNLICNDKMMSSLLELTHFLRRYIAL